MRKACALVRSPSALYSFSHHSSFIWPIERPLTSCDNMGTTDSADTLARPLLALMLSAIPLRIALLSSVSRSAGELGHICIQNPGPVIPPRHLAHIFERFYRPDASRQRSGEGAGLGLAIVKTLIEAHGEQSQPSLHPIKQRLRYQCPRLCANAP